MELVHRSPISAGCRGCQCLGKMVRGLTLPKGMIPFALGGRGLGSLSVAHSRYWDTELTPLSFLPTWFVACLVLGFLSPLSSVVQGNEDVMSGVWCLLSHCCRELVLLDLLCDELSACLLISLRIYSAATTTCTKVT